MKRMRSRSEDGISRRTLMRVATLTGLVAAGGAASEAFAQAKVSQSQAQYQDHPNDKQTCAGCANFVAPSSCQRVEGKISPNGWCTLYAAKAH